MRKGNWKRWLSVAIAVTFMICALPISFAGSKVRAAEKQSINVTYEVTTYGEWHTSNYGYILTPNLEGTFPVVVYFHGMGGPSANFPGSVKNYVEKWSKDEGIEPMIYILPCIEKGKTATQYSGLSDYYYQTYDFQYYVRDGVFKGVLDDIMNGTLTDKADVSNGISVAGLSMGGAAALYAGCKYSSIITNVGGLSPSAEAYNFDVNGKPYGFLPEDPTCEGLRYAQRTDGRKPVLYMSASETEGTWGIQNFMNAFGKANGFTATMFSSGKHDHKLFFMELFCFVYMLQHDGSLPDNDYLRTVHYFNDQGDYVPYGDRAALNKVILPENEDIQVTVPEEYRNLTVTQGDSFDLAVSATGDGLSYLWQYRVAGREWTNSTYINDEATLHVTTAVYTSEYRCIVSKGTQVAYSDIISVTVVPPQTDFTVTVKEKELTAIQGDDFYVSVDTTGNNLNYLWQYRVAGQDWTNSTYVNDQATLHVTTAVFTSDYRCIVSNANGSVTKTSDVIKVTVKPLKIASKSLTLHDTITIDFKVEKALAQGEYHDPYLVVTHNGKDEKLSSWKPSEDGTMMIFSYRVAPHQLRDTVTAVPHVFNGANKELTGEALQYSVADYCYNMLDKEEYQTEEYAPFRRLLVDILLYGEAAQKYVGYRTGELASWKLTAAQKAMGTDVSVPMIYASVKKADYETVGAADERASITNAALYLEAAVNVRFKFTASDLTGLRVVITDGTEVLKELVPDPKFKDDQGRYYVIFGGLNAGQMRKTIYATVMNGNKKVSNTYRYSIESYVESMKGKGHGAEFENLLDAMMRYGDSAAYYVSKK